MMSATKGHVTKDVAPPTKDALRTKDRAWLVLELLWLAILILPCLLVLLFRSIFPPRGKSLDGKLVVVTGAGRGLGQGLAVRFAREGSKVAVVDFNMTNAIETVKEIEHMGGVAKAYFANVAKPEDLRRVHGAVVADFDAEVDVVVNNAGIIFEESYDHQTEDMVTGVISVNLLSHIWSAKEFVPGMRVRNTGHVVAIASASAFQGVANLSTYAATKFGLRGFMESLREELNLTPGNKVKTTIVFPYFINTSADYVQHWNLRMPPLEVEEVVKQIVTGVKREEECITIPGRLYFLTHVIRVLPKYIREMGRKIFYVKISPPTRDEKDSSPSVAIVKDLSKL